MGFFYFSQLFVGFTILFQGLNSELYSLPPTQEGSKNMKTEVKFTPSEGRGNPKTAYLGKSVDDIIYDFMLKENVPGLVLSIVQAPYIPCVKGYGISDIAQKRLASTRTVWAIGPISQGYAAVAIFQLHEKGQININDHASKYVSLPESWKNITILQLLQHATGIEDYRVQENYDSQKKYTASELIASVEKAPLKFTPGTDVSLSATNFLLIAEVVEKASKMPYHQFVTKNQFELLGLKHTCFYEGLAQLHQETLNKDHSKHSEFLKDAAYINPAEAATGYNQKYEAIPFNDSAVLKGFSDIWASAEDISFWDIALAGSVLIKNPENRAMIYKPTTLSNGKTVPAMAGWQFPHHKGLMDIKGSISGFSSYLSRFTDPSELLCVTLLANKEGIDFTNLARLIASAYDKELSSGYNDNELFLYESVFSAKETFLRVEEELKKLNIPIFAKFDHGDNANKVNLELRPTQVIVFGSPSVGTQLMLENQSIAIDLPLKIAVWEDSKGSVWIAFPRMDKLAENYSSLDSNVIGNMEVLLEKIATKSTNIYKELFDSNMRKETAKE